MKLLYFYYFYITNYYYYLYYYYLSYLYDNKLLPYITPTSRFFELDQDRDGRLKLEDLARYGDFCLSDAILER